MLLINFKQHTVELRKLLQKSKKLPAVPLPNKRLVVHHQAAPKVIQHKKCLEVPAVQKRVVHLQAHQQRSAVVKLHPVHLQVRVVQVPKR